MSQRLRLVKHLEQQLTQRLQQLQPQPRGLPPGVWLRHHEHVRAGAQWHLAVEVARKDPARIVCNGLPMCTDLKRDTSLVRNMFAAFGTVRECTSLPKQQQTKTVWFVTFVDPAVVRLLLAARVTLAYLDETSVFLTSNTRRPDALFG